MSEAALTRNILADLPDFQSGIIEYRLVTTFAAAGTEGFPVKYYVQTLDAFGMGTQALPVPPSDAWLWVIKLPDGNSYANTLAAGSDLQLTTWLASAQSTETAASLADQFAGLANFDTHVADTTAVHGIADTSLLETTAGAQAKADAAEAAAIAASEPDLGNPLVDGHVLSSTIAGARSWVAGGGGGGSGDFLADGSVPMTGTLELNGIGDGETSEVFNVPVSSSDGADVNFNISSALFGTTYDTTFNWGFNNGGSGPANGTKHAWYLQLEYDYASAGTNYVEYHLNLFAANGGVDFRPFQYQYRKDGTAGSVFFRASNFYISSLSGTQVLQFTTMDTAPKFRVDARLHFQIPAAATDGIVIIGSSSVSVLTLDTTANDWTMKGRLIIFQNVSGGNALYKDTQDKWRFNGSSYNGAVINLLQATATRGIAIQQPATSPQPFIILQNSAATQIMSIATDANNNSIFTSSTAAGGYVAINSRKTTTGDPTGTSGLIVINEFDNNIKIYADGAWRTLATW